MFQQNGFIPAAAAIPSRFPLAPQLPDERPQVKPGNRVSIYAERKIAGHVNGTLYECVTVTSVDKQGNMHVKFKKSEDNNRGGPWIGGKVVEETEYIKGSDIVRVQKYI